MMKELETRLKILQKGFKKIQAHAQRRKLDRAVTKDEINEIKRAPYMMENVQRVLDFGKNKNSSIPENIPRKLT